METNTFNTSTELGQLATLLGQLGRAQTGEPAVASDDALLRLINYCYAASLLREEGRHVTFQVHLPIGGCVENWAATPVPFAVPVALHEPHQLTKLASVAVVGTGRLLTAIEVNGAIHLTGIAAQHKVDPATPTGTPHYYMTSVLRGPIIAVLGPGHLIVYGLHRPIELVGGRLVNRIGRLVDFPMVSEAFREITSAIFTGPLTFTGPHDPSPSSTDPSAMIPYYVATCWQQVIENTIAAGHGGAYVFVSGDAVPDGIRIKHPTGGPSLGTLLRENWEASYDVGADGVIEVGRKRALQAARARLIAMLKAAAAFSTVDGCVVLDQSMNVRGFGAKLIELDLSGHAPGTIVLVRADTGQPDPDLGDRVRRFGTRHLSAFNFCCANPRSLAFVISQDGDVRIFVRRENRVAMIDATDALTFPSVI